MVKGELEAIDKQLAYFRERRRNVAANCTHDEIERSDEHFYCMACGKHVGDIDGLWGEHIPGMLPYIKDDDPRIVRG